MPTIGRYQVINEIGRGASGTVYRASDPAIGREVAIKALRLEQVGTPEERERIRERLRREAKSAGVLTHPHIVTIYDVVEQDGDAYIVMELVEGPSLDTLIYQGELPPRNQTLELLRQIAGALDFAHSKRIIHRDVKPGNVLVMDGRIAKMADFGIAKIDAADDFTATGTVLGTPSYMSPEQLQGQPLTGNADQYSLAVMAYELFSGKRPFIAATISSLMYKIAHDEAAPASLLNPTLSHAVDQVLNRGLNKDPARRFPTCTAFVESLTLALQTQPGWTLPLPKQQAPAELSETVALGPAAANHDPDSAATGETAPSASQELQRRSRRLTWIALGLTVAAALWLVWFVLLPKPSTQAVAHSAPPPDDRPSAMPPAAPPKAQSQPPPEPAAPPDSSKASTPPQVADVPASQRVQFVTNPSGAILVFDGDSSTACPAPCAAELPPGAHAVVATKEGYRPATQRFKIPGDSELFLTLEAALGTLSIRSTPDGASIYVNGKLQPQKTPATLKLPVGRYQIEVVKDGFVRDSGEALVRDGAIATIESRLSPLP